MNQKEKNLPEIENKLEKNSHKSIKTMIAKKNNKNEQKNHGKEHNRLSGLRSNYNFIIN